MEMKAKEAVKILKEKRDNLAGMWGIDQVKADLTSIINAIEKGRKTVRLRLTRRSATFSFMENIANQAGVELIETDEDDVFEIGFTDDGLKLELVPEARTEQELEEDWGLSM